jgi:hypothetical protein
MFDLYRVLAIVVDLTHATAMLLWGLGLPLLFWHRFERLSHAYSIYAIVFVVTTVASHLAMGECFLTSLARTLWLASGHARDTVPFTVIVTNTIAGFRPSSRSAVLLWEAAVLVTSLGSWWSWHRAHVRRGARLGLD